MEARIEEVAGLAAELLASGPTVDLQTASRALGISKSHGYALAHRREYPVRVLTLGTRYRVIAAELLTVLGIERPQKVTAA